MASRAIHIESELDHILMETVGIDQADVLLYILPGTSWKD